MLDFLLCRLDRLKLDDSQPKVSVVGANRVLLLKSGVNRGADDDEFDDCVGAAAIEFSGLVWRICDRSGLSLKASPYLGLFTIGFLFFSALATLLV